MTKITSIKRGMQSVLAHVHAEQEQEGDAHVHDMVTQDLLHDLATFIAHDATFPDGVSKAITRRTPDELAAIERWGRRHNAAGAKESLLRQLEAHITAEEKEDEHE